MELGEGETPSATVVRSSKPPSVRSVSSTKNKSSAAAGDGKKKVSFDHACGGFQPTNNLMNEEGGDSTKAAHENKSEGKVRTVFLSDSIKERPVTYEGNDLSSGNRTSSKRESRFKQRNRIKNGQPSFSPTVGGFPSLDIAPVGTLTRKGRLCNDDSVHSKPSMASCPPDKLSQIQSNLDKNISTLGSAGQSKLTDDVGNAADSMIANMSPEEIRDALDEITSVLSADSIAFLNKRGREKLTKSPSRVQQNFSSIRKCPVKATIKNDVAPSREDEIEQEEQREREAKEKMAQILSSVRTHEDMDRAYNEAVKLGLATELPSSTLEEGEAILLKHENSSADPNCRHKYLHVATSLLRSTSPRQRLLGAKTICTILEEDTNQIIKSREGKISRPRENDDRSSLKHSYPPLLPVAIRCLLDEAISTSHTSSGRILLGIVLRCINSLMILFVHPYHVVYIGQSSYHATDASSLYQTCFMSDIFHVPPGSLLYPPTEIEPIEDEGARDASCYRTNSSAVSAESDSKAFYTDPAWTMISRMKMIPCISKVVTCLLEGFGEKIPITDLRPVFGILAMLAVRSPGAAVAIASHREILPVLLSFCISPSNHNFDYRNVVDNCVDHKSSRERGTGNGIERSEFCKIATPALQLLCIIARQSRDVAQLELFETIIPDLQAILCMSEESGPQKWSLILLRTLLQYGLALQHTQSIISLATPHITVMSDDPHKLSAEYLTLFARICDCARAYSAQRKENVEIRATPDPEVLDNLAMSGIWLSSSVKTCVNSLISIRDSSLSAPNCPITRFQKMRLSAAQLRLLSAFTLASSPTSFFDDDELRDKIKSNFIPVVSSESCFDVFESILKSNLWKNAIDIALRHCFNSGWIVSGDTPSLEEESIACVFVAEFMSFAGTIKQKVNGHDNSHKTLIAMIKNTLVRFRQNLQRFKEDSINPSRQSWFIEAEFAVLKYLIDMGHVQLLDSTLLMDFAFSLIGRLTVGHETMAVFIFSQDNLFSIPDASNDTESMTSHTKSLQKALLSELCNASSRRAQLEHSACLHYSSNALQPRPFKLRSLRSNADVIVASGAGAQDERSLLPMGEIWLWNLVSSTVEMPRGSSNLAVIPETSNAVTNASDIVSHALKLLLHLEAASLESCHSSRVDKGTKLYHITNVFLYPEEVLSAIERTAAVLFRMLDDSEPSNTNASTLIPDFITACYNHSRISKDKKPASPQSSDELSDDSYPTSVFSQAQQSSDGLSQDKLQALDDFVSDICESYLEYGGQYESFSMCLRLFLRHDFPPKVISDVLTKLHPILKLLTIKADRKSLHSSLMQSVSGGLPSVDASRRDPSSVLDAFAVALKKRERELSREDYIYLLAIAVLSRNLASSSQRCECGLEAMKKRLSGISRVVFYDVFQVSKLLLESAAGTKESLIGATLDTCLNSSSSLFLQNVDVQNKWAWNKSSEDTVWADAVAFLGKNECK